ncbi:hypothetical protein QR680_004583 [Steinernema hermaphroditum]|uniref:Uncharacterized protein n=1 Tax=Steinernema hermaphroditum TaxID=289476 RepID=A0AA39LTX9_9BILA|nr:hypothetical protein QR680_004583 [Steinernema hermaphroditum]
MRVSLPPLQLLRHTAAPQSTKMDPVIVYIMLAFLACACLMVFKFPIKAATTDNSFKSSAQKKKKAVKNKKKKNVKGAAVKKAAESKKEEVNDNKITEKKVKEAAPVPANPVAESDASVLAAAKSSADDSKTVSKLQADKEVKEVDKESPNDNKKIKKQREKNTKKKQDKKTKTKETPKIEEAEGFDEGEFTIVLTAKQKKEARNKKLASPTQKAVPNSAELAKKLEKEEDFTANSSKSETFECYEHLSPEQQEDKLDLPNDFALLSYDIVDMVVTSQVPIVGQLAYISGPWGDIYRKKTEIFCMNGYDTEHYDCIRRNAHGCVMLKSFTANDFLSSEKIRFTALRSANTSFLESVMHKMTDTIEIDILPGVMPFLATLPDQFSSIQLHRDCHITVDVDVDLLIRLLQFKHLRRLSYTFVASVAEATMLDSYLCSFVSKPNFEELRVRWINLRTVPTCLEVIHAAFEAWENNRSSIIIKQEIEFFLPGSMRWTADSLLNEPNCQQHQHNSDRIAAVSVSNYHLKAEFGAISTECA